MLLLSVVVALAASPKSAALWSRAPVATGRIQGNVVLSPALSVRKPRIRMYGDYGPVPAPKPPPATEFANVVLYLDSVPTTDDSMGRSRRLEIQQQGEAFQPHVLAVLRGTTVAFPNNDPVFHNVFSLSSARTFDLGRYPKGTSKEVRFDRAGTVQVFCHIHSDMSAVVLVLDNPYFASPDSTGRYAIPDVPDGDYTIVAWHERIKPVRQRVRVVAGRPAVMDFNIPLPASSP